ncbi:MAG: SWIM zinc finger domain-containing protein [Desulfovibrio sp.]|nr:SWIM zinc finger domain-containing protein [Desulfovibrio sp.]
MPKPQVSLKSLERLSWSDIVERAGSQVASRGREYQRRGLVEDLAVTESGIIVATVRGSKPYAVQVSMDTKGDLQSHCTCPYAFFCKHSVATLLEYLTSIDQGKPVPLADPLDARLACLDSGTGEEDGEDDSSRNMALVESLLQKKTKAQLVSMILGYAETYPKLLSELLDKAQLDSGNFASLKARVQRDIRTISSESAYWNSGDDDGPDYSGIHDRLEALLAAGQADDVLTLGKELLDRGLSLIETSNDDMTAYEIAMCLEVIPKALAASSLPETERLLWALDGVLADSYNICSSCADYLRQKHPASAWNVVADRLLQRLHSDPRWQEDGENNRYARDAFVDWIVHALEQAGRHDESISLCQEEAPKTQSYVRLVQRLIVGQRYEEAERWIRRGVAATEQSLSGIAAQLRELLLDIRIRHEDWSAVTILHVEAFVRSPSAQAFEKCQEAAEHLGLWPTMRQCLLEYLVSGRIPWEQAQWPLSASDMCAPKSKAHGSFPATHVLINIAIAENKPEEVLRWYDLHDRNNISSYDTLDINVAEAIKTHAPLRAVEIWKSLAQEHIALVKPRGYETAVKYLRKVGEVMLQEKKKAEWMQYLNSLRTEHRRKRLFLELLDTFDDQPIVRRKR